MSVSSDAGRRWRPQFSLRSVGVWVAVVSIVAAYVGWRMEHGRRRHVLAKTLFNQGFEVDGYACHGSRYSKRSPERIAAYKALDESRWTDSLWLCGAGPQVFPESTFLHCLAIDSFDVDCDPLGPDHLWRQIAAFPEIEELDLSDPAIEWFRSPAALPALRRLTRLKSLRLQGPLDPKVLENVAPPRSLSTLILSNVVIDSPEPLAKYLERSRISYLLIDRCPSSALILAAAEKAPPLVMLDLVAIEFDVATVDNLVKIRPKELIVTRSTIKPDDAIAAKRLARMGLSPDYTLLVQEEWDRCRAKDTGRTNPR